MLPMLCHSCGLTKPALRDGGNSMKSHLRADAPPDPLHESQAFLDSHSLGFARTAEQAQLNAIYAGVADAIVLVDEEGKVQRINPAFTRVFGYSEEDAVGRSLGALIALDDPLEELETHTSMASGQSEVVIPETVRRRNDGIHVPVSLIKVPVRSPRSANCWYLIYRDLTERKRLEDELSRERDRLRLLLEITHGMTSKLDLSQLIAVLSTDLLSVMQCDFCALLLPDADSGELRVTTLYNPQARGALCDGTIIPIHGSICGKAFWTGKTQHFNHFEEVRYDPESFGNSIGRPFYQRVMAEGLISGCDLPLIGRNRVVGVLAALKRSEKAFTKDDVAFLEQVARQVAIAVENALDYEGALKEKDKETKQRLYLEEES